LLNSSQKGCVTIALLSDRESTPSGTDSSASRSRMQPSMSFKVATAVVALLFIIGFVHFFGPVPDHLPTAKSAKMDVWFFALDSREGGIHMYAKQAVLSAKAKTSLIPVCLYHGDPTIITPIEHWLLDNDVVCVYVTWLYVTSASA
jgi:hypothetical protein